MPEPINSDYDGGGGYSQRHEEERYDNVITEEEHQYKYTYEDDTTTRQNTDTDQKRKLTCIMSDRIKDSVPYGVIVLISSYVFMTSLVLTQTDPTNGLLYWAVDFFTFALTGILSVHMLVHESNQVGGLLFFFTALGYLTRTFNTVFMGSNWSIQYDDDKTSLDGGAFILTIISFFLWTLATVLLFVFVQAAWMMIEDVHGACGMVPAKCSVFAIISSAGVLFVGGIWSAIIAPSSSSSTSSEATNSDNEETTSQYHFANILFWVAQLTWYLSFCSFAISVASVCGALAKDQGAIRVWGLSSSWASFGLVFCQVVVAVILGFSVLNSVGGHPYQNNDGVDYPYIFFNVASTLSLFFIHNLVHMVFRKLPTNLDETQINDMIDEMEKAKGEPETEEETDKEIDTDEDKADSVVESSSVHGGQSNWACAMPGMCVSPPESSTIDTTVVSPQQIEISNDAPSSMMVEPEPTKDDVEVLMEPIQIELTHVQDDDNRSIVSDAAERKTTKILVMASMGLLNNSTSNAGVDALVRMASLQRPQSPTRRRHQDDEEETVDGGGPTDPSKLVLKMVRSMDQQPEEAEV